MVWYWVIGILSFLLGVVAGFYLAVQYMKKQMANMQMSEAEIQAMARSMGRNLNKKQLAQITRQMKNVNEKNKQSLFKKKK
ncbi:hypothetical protein EFBL_3097 [Effusibacillus lacus]|uniref:YneF family protein n=2 Tax=Effusibacillus lacus TaxID=1348429 RepID=A0A292YNC0_9BACL|nr:hypothetical protein EFBL_3097 [Effusibacillus lacus]